MSGIKEMIRDLGSLFEGEALSDTNIKRFLKRNRENIYKSRLMRRNWKV